MRWMEVGLQALCIKEVSMKINLNLKNIYLEGERNHISLAICEALTFNGGKMLSATSKIVPDIILISLPLQPDDGLDFNIYFQKIEIIKEKISKKKGGRLLFIISALSEIPMRRYHSYSIGMSGIRTAIKTLAMSLGPTTLVNGIGVGLVGEPLISGDRSMSSHTPIKTAGSIKQVSDTALFFCDPLNSYTTGQILCVDGGWSGGFKRNI